MNAADRSEFLRRLTEAMEDVLTDEDLHAVVDVPITGNSTFVHMAMAALNVLEAIEDVEVYIGGQLNDETREAIGI